MPTPKLVEGDISELDALKFLLECAGEEHPQAVAQQMLRDYGGLFEAVRGAKGPGFSEELRVLAALTENEGVRRDEHLSTGGRRFADTETAGRFFEKWFEGQDTEQLVMLCLDENFRGVDCRVIADGGETAVRFDMNELLEYARLSGAEYIILAHNHPYSSALPSRDDLKTTGIVAWALYACGFELIDHIIVYRDDYVSMSESEILNRPGNRALRAKFAVHHGKLYYTDGEED